MNDSAASSLRRDDDVRQAKQKPKGTGADPVEALSPGTTRKLIRPRLPEGFAVNRRPSRISAMPALSVSAGKVRSTDRSGESSHAEVFYFQKQIQSQTLMIFVLEDGQHIKGYIEWYDRDCIKVKHGHRSLIYKSSIKYLYKAPSHPAL